MQADKIVRGGISHGVSKGQWPDTTQGVMVDLVKQKAGICKLPRNDGFR